MAVLGWKELRALNDLHQKGDIRTLQNEEWLSDLDMDAEDAQAQFDQRVLDRYAVRKPSGDEQMAQLAELQKQDYRPEYTAEDIAESGYGESRYDKRVPFDQWIKDPINYRSNAQSGFNQIVSGLAKMGAYGVATYADNLAGLLVGLGNVAVDAVDGDGFKPTQSFIDNWWSREITENLREWSDRAMPNYRTREEIEDADHWWNHLNANFIGDTFLKNLGFTLGAGASGGVFAKLFRLGQGRVVNRAYKAALAASEGDAAAEAAFREVLQGASQSAEKVFNTFEKTKKSFNRLKWESQLVGAVGGAMGESRMEAMQAAKEFRDEQSMDYQGEYEARKMALQYEVMSNPNFLTKEPVYDGFGNEVDSRTVLNDAGKDYYTHKLSELQKDYSEKQSVIDSEAERLANFTFWPNMILLTASNAIMFGRMFAGGFKTQARAKVRGNFGNYKQKGSVASGIGRGLLTATSEGMEELSQKVISEGMKDIAGVNVSSFHDGKYDENAIKDVSSWMSSVINSAGNVIDEPTSWEEFAIGFITGGLMESVAGGAKNSREQRKLSKKFADKLNERIKQDEFRTLWEGLVRHRHYETVKDTLLDSKLNGKEVKDKNGNPVGTQFAWQTENDAQIINDVMMFADAGRLDDLEAYVDSFANISEDELPNLSSMLSDETQKDFDKKSTEDKLAWVKDRAFQIKKAINQYRNFYDSIDALSLGTSSPEAMKEMIFTQSQLQNFEDRYNSIVDSVIAAIKPSIEEVAKEKKADGSPTADALVAQKLLESETDMRLIFGGRALDIRGIGQDSKSPIGIYAAAVDDRHQRNVLEKLEEWGAFTKDPEVKQQVKDLQSLVRSRQDYYARLFSPRGRKSYAERFEESAKKPEEVVKTITAEERAKNVDKYMEKLRTAKTLGEYLKVQMDDIPELDAETEAALDEAIKKDKKLAGFEKQFEDARNFYNQVKKQVDDELDEAQDPARVQVLQDMSDALDSIGDLTDIAANTPADSNLLVEVAKNLLDSTAGNPGANALARQIIQEKLGDLAQSKRLGLMPTAGTGGNAGGEDGRTYTNKSGEKFSAGDTVANKKTGEQKKISALGEGIVSFEGGNPEHVSILDDYSLVPAEEGGVGGGEGTVSQFKYLSDLLGMVNNYDDSLLEKIANGDFSEYPGLTDAEKLQLSAMAAARIESIKARKGLIATKEGGTEALGTDEKPEDDPQRIRAKQENLTMKTSALPLNDPFFIYDPRELRNGRVKRYEGDRRKGTAQTLSWMRDHRVQEFIDTGALAVLEEKYRKEGKQLPVYFVANPYYAPDNKDNNPFTGPYRGKDRKYENTTEVLLAVEMTEDDRKALAAYEEKGVFDSSTLLTIEGKQYQVIGQMWNGDPKTWENKPEAERALYDEAKKQATTVWDYAIDRSIRPQFEAEGGNKSSAFDAKGKWYVAKVHPITDTQETDEHKPDWTTGKRLYTTLNYIMSGRNETRAIGQNDYQKIPLANSLSDYRSVGGKIHFSLMAPNKQKDVDMVSTPGAPEFPIGINAPRGSLWMATKAANGAWEWTAITIKRTNEYDFAANQNSKIVQRIIKSLEVLFKPANPNASDDEHKQDFANRLTAQKELQKLIYLGSGNTIYTSFGQSGPVVWIAGARTTSVQDAIELLSSPDYSFRFQVSEETLENPEQMEELINAGILTSEMRSFIRRGASVGVNFLEDRDENNNLVTPYPRANNDVVARTPGSNANENQETDSYQLRTEEGEVINNIRIGSAGYQLHPDGSVYRMEKRGMSGERVDDRKTVAAVKALAELVGKRPVDYGGKAWVIETKVANRSGKEAQIQYTELYERIVDGVTIHMIREGRNGAIQVVFGDAKWNALKESLDIKQMSISYEKPQASPEAEQAAAQEEFDKLRAEEARGQQTPSEEKPEGKPESKPKRWRRSATLQDETIQDQKDEEEDDCG